ncbi:MAG: class II aldolase/adducin family protein [Rhodopseudomonas sp.]|nr:class II aldolase/adducin family protein [Rhodopseudomonas sp.]
MCSGANDANPETISESVADAATPATATTKALLEDLVFANHILFNNGVVDAFGHVSVRHDARADRFLLARNMAPGNVTAGDIIEFNLDGEPVNANGRRVYLERFIHSEIYRAHPEVMAVVHSHSHAIVPLSVVKSFPLRPIFHMAGFIGTAAPVFEIRDIGGSATDLLISNRTFGKALADMFKTSKIVLMRGHGSTVVADNLQKVVYRAVYAELNARYQVTANGLGPITYLSEEEAQCCAKNIEGQVQRPWDLWKEEARRTAAARGAKSD